MSVEWTAFFDPPTLAMLRNVLDDAWSRLPAARTRFLARCWRNAFLGPPRKASAIRRVFARVR
jgi:hypothetical protein